MPQYIFKDPEVAVRVMRRRGYSILRDRATGVLFARSDRLVIMEPDGEARSVSPTAWPRWAARCELAEIADERTEVTRW